MNHPSEGTRSPPARPGSAVAAATDAEWQAFEHSLEREILASERLRVTIIAVVIATLLAMSGVVGILFPQVLPREMSDKVDLTVISPVLAAFLLHELWMRHRIDNCIAQGRALWTGLRYSTALVETSLPTAALFYFGAVTQPVLALHFTPMLAYFLFILAATLRMDFKLSLFTGLVAAGGFATVGVWALQGPAPEGFPSFLLTPQLHGSKCIVLLAGGLVSGVVGLELRKRWERAVGHLRERNRVMEVFGQHVSPAVVDRLLAQHTGSGTETRNVCVMFLDIRGFTAFSEGRAPEEVVAYLNRLFAFMIDAVNRNHGIVNKFLGDGFMAVFGAPLSDGADCQNAVRAAREITAEVERLVASGEIPPTRIGIGLHAGDAVTGNVGSPQRKEYTIIGDVVNLASRVEGMNKELQSQILATQQVVGAAGAAAEGATDRGEVPVRGRLAGVRVFQLG